MPILQTSKSFTWQGEWGVPMFIHSKSIQDFIQRLKENLLKDLLENLCCWEHLRFLPLYVSHSMLTSLFGYLRRIGCTGTPGMKAPITTVKYYSIFLIGLYSLQWRKLIISDIPFLTGLRVHINYLLKVGKSLVFTKTKAL